MKQVGISSQSMEISRFWLRRLCEAGLFISLAILLTYIWARFVPTGYRLMIGESIHDFAAAVAALTGIIFLCLCFWMPRARFGAVVVAAYSLIAFTITILIATSGYLSSPFSALWVVVAIFAAFFGLIMVAITSTLVILMASSVLIASNLTSDAISIIILGLLPVGIGFILWHKQPIGGRINTVSELQTRLSSAEGKSDIVINAIDDGVLAISSAGVIELINPSAQRILGWQADDALGLNWRSVIRLVINDGQPIVDANNPIVQALIHNQSAHSDKFMLQTISEKQIFVSVVASPIGRDEGVIVVFRDITKERAEERQQAEFISTASHEMRTPVASIEGYLGLALNPATAQIDDKARDFITKAHESARHLGRLFQDLLDVSRAEDGRLSNSPKIVNINEFTKEIFDGLAPQAAAKQLKYAFKPAEDLDVEGAKTLRPVFYADVDPDHLREVTANLIENAIKYTPEGDVVVDVNGDDKFVYISIQDTGIGIPAEDVPHLFQKFYRVDNSDTREINGTGLGLYLSRRLAEAMGGNLTAESEYKKGSTFILAVPRMHNDEAVGKLHQQKLEQGVSVVNQPSAAPDPVFQAPAPLTVADIETRLNPERNQLTVPRRQP